VAELSTKELLEVAAASQDELTRRWALSSVLALLEQMQVELARLRATDLRNTLRLVPNRLPTPTPKSTTEGEK